MEIILGLFFVSLAGLGTGTGAWPIKALKEFHFASFLFLFIVSGLIIYPWIIIFINVPDPAAVIKAVGAETLIKANLMSVCWGLANVIFVVCVIRIGAALSGAILSALGMSVGVIIPMVLKGSGLFSNAPDLFSKAGLFILLGLLVLIMGVVLVSKAGFEREKFYKHPDNIGKNTKTSGSFMSGLVLLVIAGVLSCGLSLSFVYSQGPIIEAVRLQGAGELTANISVWALAAIGGIAVNLIYAAYIMTKEKSWNMIFKMNEFVIAFIAGGQLIISIMLLGKGMVYLGALGASIGFGIQQSMQIIGNQVLGFLTKEWHGITGRPLNTMYTAIVTILVAVGILAYSNTI